MLRTKHNLHIPSMLHHPLHLKGQLAISSTHSKENYWNQIKMKVKGFNLINCELVCYDTADKLIVLSQQQQQ